MNDDEVESQALIYPLAYLKVSRKSVRSSMYRYLLCVFLSSALVIVYIQNNVQQGQRTPVVAFRSEISPAKGTADSRVKVFHEMQKIWHRFTPLCTAPSNVNSEDPLPHIWDKSDEVTCPLGPLLTLLNETTGLLEVLGHQQCYYSSMTRSSYDENEIIYGPRFPLRAGVYLTDSLSTVNVSCYKNSTVIYENTHLYVSAFKRKRCDENCRHDNQLAQERENRPVIQSNGDVKPNVLVIFLESLSRMNFDRTMVKTKAALQSLGHVTTLKYFVKPVDNSFPNTMAMLTGERIDWPRESTLKAGYFDNKFDFLWDYFHAAGYVTGFMEDLARISVFKYGKWGFKQQPVDFYPRPFWLQMYPNASAFDLNRAMAYKDEFCFQKNGKKVTLFTDQIRQFMVKQSEPAFLFAFYSQMTHNLLHSYRWVDEDFADLFTSLQGHLNNTIVVFAGDHGFRMSPYAATSLGRLEERMNLVTIRIPEEIDRKHPHLRLFLNANADRLITWFDVNLMLRQFATGEYKLFPSLDTYGSLDVAINPTRQFVHPLRTCSHASILPEYCVCNQFVSVNTEGTYSTFDVVSAGKALVTVINGILGRKYSDCELQVYNSTDLFKYYIPPDASNHLIGVAYTRIHLTPSNVMIASFVTREQRSVYNVWSLDETMNSRFNLSLDLSLNAPAFGCSDLL